MRFKSFISISRFIAFGTNLVIIYGIRMKISVFSFLNVIHVITNDRLRELCHPVCSVSATPSKTRLIDFCNKWRTPVHCHREKQQGFTTLHSAVSHSVNEVGKHIYKWWLARWLYQTQADACGSRAIKWFWRLAHGCWSPLPTYRISCDAGSDDLLGRMCHPVCSESATPSKARLNGYCNRWRIPVHCYREKQQGFTLLHSAVSHNGNEVGKHIYKWWLARWFYRTQADACGSRAIEWFRRLAHGCWPPLPTYRIACDAGSDDLLGKKRHPVCSVSSTPSKAWLIGFCYEWKTPVRCHRENLQGSTSLHFVGSHNGNGFREAHLQDG